MMLAVKLLFLWKSKKKKKKMVQMLLVKSAVSQKPCNKMPRRNEQENKWVSGIAAKRASQEVLESQTEEENEPL